MSKDTTQQTTPADETTTDVTPTGEMPTSDASNETLETTSTPTETSSESDSAGSSTPEDLQKEVERLQTALKKANKEAAAHRVKAKELDDLKAQIEQEKLSEKERLEKKLAELQKAHDDATARAQEYRVSAEVRLQAMQLGFADAADAMRFLDYADIEYDESGAPENVAELLKGVLKQKPYLAAKAQTHAPATSGGATNPSRSQTNTPPTLSWEVIKKMTSAEYEARHPEIAAWIAKNPAARRGMR